MYVNISFLNESKDVLLHADKYIFTDEYVKFDCCKYILLLESISLIKIDGKLVFTNDDNGVYNFNGVNVNIG